MSEISHDEYYNYGIGQPDWARQQAEDDANDKRILTEAFNSLYLAINRLEILDNCQYTDLRRDVRFIELKIWGK